MFETLKNVFRVKEMRRKLLYVASCTRRGQ